MNSFKKIIALFHPRSKNSAADADMFDVPRLRVVAFASSDWVVEFNRGQSWERLTRCSLGWGASMNERHFPMIGTQSECVEWATKLAEAGALDAFIKSQDDTWAAYQPQLSAELEARKQIINIEGKSHD